MSQTQHEWICDMHVKVNNISLETYKTYVYVVRLFEEKTEISF